MFQNEKEMESPFVCFTLLVVDKKKVEGRPPLKKIDGWRKDAREAGAARERPASRPAESNNSRKLSSERARFFFLFFSFLFFSFLFLARRERREWATWLESGGEVRRPRGVADREDLSERCD
jgi:hypothetical protein